MSDKYLNGEGLEHLVEKIKSLVIANKVIQDNAASHNAFYVEEDITDMYNDGTFTRNVENGTFKDIFPGMYITKTYTADIDTDLTDNFIVGDLDYFMHIHELETHHALMFPFYGSNRYIMKMNTTTTNTGGYLGTYMWNTVMPMYSEAMENAFGAGHIVEHKRYLSNGITTTERSRAYYGYTGAASSYSLVNNVKYNLMSNYMVGGVSQSTSSVFDSCDAVRQISAFRNNSSLMYIRRRHDYYIEPYWLSDVVNKDSYAMVSSRGLTFAHYYNNNLHIRGYFLLK